MKPGKLADGKLLIIHGYLNTRFAELLYYFRQVTNAKIYHPGLRIFTKIIGITFERTEYRWALFLYPWKLVEV